jgi:hypothetical protein
MAVEGNGRETEPATKGANGQTVAPRPRAEAVKVKKGISFLSIIFR